MGELGKMKAAYQLFTKINGKRVPLQFIFKKNFGIGLMMIQHQRKLWASTVTPGFIYFPLYMDGQLPENTILRTFVGFSRDEQYGSANTIDIADNLDWFCTDQSCFENNKDTAGRSYIQIEAGFAIRYKTKTGNETYLIQPALLEPEGLDFNCVPDNSRGQNKYTPVTPLTYEQYAALQGHLRFRLTIPELSYCHLLVTGAELLIYSHNVELRKDSTNYAYNTINSNTLDYIPIQLHGEGNYTMRLPFNENKIRVTIGNRIEIIEKSQVTLEDIPFETLTDKNAIKKIEILE